MKLFKLTKKPGRTIPNATIALAAIAVVIIIMIWIINPPKRIAQTRNAERWNDIQMLSDAVYDYGIDHGGDLSNLLPTEITEICRSDANDCSDLVDLMVLNDSKTYITDIPSDPTTKSSTGTNYFIRLNKNNRVEIIAPNAELEVHMLIVR